MPTTFAERQAFGCHRGSFDDSRRVGLLVYAALLSYLFCELRSRRTAANQSTFLCSLRLPLTGEKTYESVGRYGSCGCPGIRCLGYVGPKSEHTGKRRCVGERPSFSSAVPGRRTLQLPHESQQSGRSGTIHYEADAKGRANKDSSAHLLRSFALVRLEVQRAKHCSTK